MKNIYFTSDTHYNHRNICRGTSEWSAKGREIFEQNTRDFETLDKMNYTLIKGINDNVKLDDELWHLGDWSFGGFDSILQFRNQLVCQNIHLVYGNHDHHIENNKNGVQVAFKSVQYYKELSIEGRKICLLHYAMRVFNKSHKGAYHFYGHSHSSLEHSPNGKSIDVGVDNAFRLFGQYRPFSFKELQTILEKRDINFIDHHSKNTD